MNAPRARVLAVIASFLCLASCSVNLALAPVGIQVELYFTRPHTAISATWNGTMVETQYSNETFPNSERRASGILPGNIDVESPVLVQFAPAVNLFAGIWDITIDIREGGTILQQIRCRATSVGGNGLRTGNIYTVRWIEGGSGDCVTDVGLEDPTVDRDASAVSMSVPTSAVLGSSVPISVSVRNNGEITEAIDVAVTAQPPGGLPRVSVANQDIDVFSAASAQLDLNWNTSCVGPAGNYSLTAVATVPDDNDAANNTTAPQSITLSADREIQLGNPVGPATVARATPGGTQYRVTITNGNSQPENAVNITVVDTSTVEGSGAIQWLGESQPPLNLQCGETRTLYFVYFAPSFGAGGLHTLTLTLAPAAPIPGDDPLNNVVTLPITVTP
jgi:hypothetical protein